MPLAGGAGGARSKTKNLDGAGASSSSGPTNLNKSSSFIRSQQNGDRPNGDNHRETEQNGKHCEFHEALQHQEVTALDLHLGNMIIPEIPCTQSTSFGLAVGVVVMLNATCLGIEADWGDKYPVAFDVIENIFCVVFTMELVARFRVEGVRAYFSDRFNWLDFFLVMCSIISSWIIQPIGLNADLKMMSVLRMLRLIRLARLLRLFRTFRELTLLVSGFVDALKTLVWAFIFLILVMYAFAIFARQMIGAASECPDSDPDCGEPKYHFNEEIGNQEKLFGSVDRCMLTLFVCLTEGCGLEVIVPVVLESPWLALYWIGFILLTTYGLVNLIVGCFCENAIQTANDQEQEIAKTRDLERQKKVEHLKDAFEQMDADQSETLTKEEFNDALRTNEEVRNALIECGLGGESNLYNTLDAEKTGNITFNQFFEGLTLIMRGRETARAKDMVGSLLTCQAIARRTQKLQSQTDVLIEKVSDLSKLMGVPGVREHPFNSIGCNRYHPGTDGMTDANNGSVTVKGRPNRSDDGDDVVFLAIPSTTSSPSSDPLDHYNLADGRIDQVKTKQHCEAAGAKELETTPSRHLERKIESVDKKVDKLNTRFAEHERSMLMWMGKIDGHLQAMRRDSHGCSESRAPDTMNRPPDLVFVNPIGV